MIIEEIEIKNYQCYFGSKVFKFSKGLNIILGKNGDGKTKFYEAIDWLFSDGIDDKESLFSAKASHKMSNGDSEQVMVRMTVKQDGERRTIRKQFIVSKENEEFNFGNTKLEGIEETNSGERSLVDGGRLRDLIFDSRIRQYSMFKGESELNVFDNKDALNNLIDLFSDTKHLDKYVDCITEMYNKADRAVSADAKKNKSNQKKYSILEADINKLKVDEGELKLQISNIQKELTKLEDNIDQASSLVDNAEKLETYNKRIANKENKIRDLRAKIADLESYTTNLYDENWFLVFFEPIYNDFKKKAISFSKDRRRLMAKYNQDIGRKKGEEDAKKKIMESIPLPIGTPSQAHMEEMLDEELCKVCNRLAEKGSEAYNYMYQRLQEFIESQKISQTEDENDKPKKLFQYNYTTKLTALSDIHEQYLHGIRQIDVDIKDTFDFVENRKKDLEEQEKVLNSEYEERSKIVSSSSVEASSLTNILKNYNGFQKNKAENKDDLVRYEFDLKRIRQNLNTKQGEKDALDKVQVDKFLLNTKEILGDILKVTEQTRSKEFNDFIDKLESLSNEIFKNTNKGSFTGVIKFYKIKYGDETKVDIRLVESTGKKFEGNSAQVTLLHISVLLAISELVKEADDQSYPMIMDAPVSNFDEMHSKLFFEAMKSSVDQSILLLKDYVVRNEKTDQLEVKNEFNEIKKDKAFWIRLEEPYQNELLHTIDTQIIEL